VKEKMMVYLVVLEDYEDSRVAALELEFEDAVFRASDIATRYAEKRSRGKLPEYAFRAIKIFTMEPGKDYNSMKEQEKALVWLKEVER
jgi:hypothetical protein